MHRFDRAARWDRQTDGQTDGRINAFTIARTRLALRALARKKNYRKKNEKRKDKVYPPEKIRPVFELPGMRVKPPNCFLNPRANTLSNYVLGGQHIYYIGLHRIYIKI